MAAARLPTRKIAACVFGLLLALTACLYSTWDPDAPYKYPGPENNRVMWPVAKGRVVSHDSFFCQKYPPSVPWPTQREAGFFVGAPSLRPEYSKSSLTQPCPEACRPPRHKDWTFC